MSLNSQPGILKLSVISVCTITLLLVGGLGLEIGHAALVRFDLQKAVDAAALAGAASVEVDEAKAKNDALSAAARNNANGLPVSNKSKQIKVSVQTIHSVNGISGISVSASMSVDRFLQGMFGHPTENISVASYAGSSGTVTKVDIGRVFPLAVSIDGFAVRATKGQRATQSPTVNLRLDGQSGKTASFVTFKKDNKSADSLRKLIAAAAKGGPTAAKIIPSVQIGDTLYVSRGSAGQSQLANPQLIPTLSGKIILLPVIATQRKGEAKIIGFMSGKVEAVHCKRRLVDYISLKIIKTAAGATSGTLAPTGTKANDLALREISAGTIKLLSLPAKQNVQAASVASAKHSATRVVANTSSKNQNTTKNIVDRPGSTAPLSESKNGNAKVASSPIGEKAQTIALEHNSGASAKTSSAKQQTNSQARNDEANPQAQKADGAGGTQKTGDKATHTFAGGVMREDSSRTVTSPTNAKTQTAALVSDAKPTPQDDHNGAPAKTVPAKSDLKAKAHDDLPVSPAKKTTLAIPQDDRSSAPAKTALAKSDTKTKAHDDLPVSPAKKTALAIPQDDHTSAPAKTVPAKSDTKTKAHDDLPVSPAKKTALAIPQDDHSSAPAKAVPAKSDTKTVAHDDLPVSPAKKTALAIPQDDHSSAPAKAALAKSDRKAKARDERPISPAKKTETENKEITSFKKSSGVTEQDTPAESSPIGGTKSANIVDADDSNVEAVPGLDAVHQVADVVPIAADNPPQSNSIKVGMYECLVGFGILLLAFAGIWAVRISRQGNDTGRLRKTFKPAKEETNTDGGAKDKNIVAPAQLRFSRGRAMQHWGFGKETPPAEAPKPEERKRTLNDELEGL